MLITVSSESQLGDEAPTTPVPLEDAPNLSSPPVQIRSNRASAFNPLRSEETNHFRNETVFPAPFPSSAIMANTNRFPQLPISPPSPSACHEFQDYERGVYADDEDDSGFFLIAPTKNREHYFKDPPFPPFPKVNRRIDETCFSREQNFEPNPLQHHSNQESTENCDINNHSDRNQSTSHRASPRLNPLRECRRPFLKPSSRGVDF